MPKFLTFRGCFSEIWSKYVRCVVPGVWFIPFLCVMTYLVDGNDLTGGLLDLLQAAKEVPVPGLGNDGVGGKDTHAVQSGRRVGLGRQMPANDLVLMKTA